MVRSLLDILIIVISAGARASASVSGLSTASRTAARLVVVVVALGRGWAHKGKVDRDSLVKQLCVVDSFDGSLCLVQCREFNQDVALWGTVSILFLLLARGAVHTLT